MKRSHGHGRQLEPATHSISRLIIPLIHLTILPPTGDRAEDKPHLGAKYTYSSIYRREKEPADFQVLNPLGNKTGARASPVKRGRRKRR